MIKQALQLRKRRRRKLVEKNVSRRESVDKQPSKALAIASFAAMLTCLLAFVTWSVISQRYDTEFLLPSWDGWKGSEIASTSCGQITHQLNLCSESGSVTCYQLKSHAISCNIRKAVMAKAPVKNAKDLMISGAITTICKPLFDIHNTIPEPSPRKAIWHAIKPSKRSVQNTVCNGPNLVMIHSSVSSITQTSKGLSAINSFLGELVQFQQLTTAAGIRGDEAIVVVSEKIGVGVWKVMKQAGLIRDVFLESTLAKSDEKCWNNVLYIVKPSKYRLSLDNNCAKKDISALVQPIRSLAGNLRSSLVEKAGETYYETYMSADAYAGHDFGSPMDGRDIQNCKQWCQKNNECTGFTLYQNMCYFRNQADLLKKKVLTADAKLFAIRRKSHLPSILYISEKGVRVGEIWNSLGGSKDLSFTLIQGEDSNFQQLMAHIQRSDLVLISTQGFEDYHISIALLLRPCSALYVISNNPVSIPPALSALRPDLRIGTCPPSPSLPHILSLAKHRDSASCHANGQKTVSKAVSSATSRIPGGFDKKRDKKGGRHRLGVIVPFRDSKDPSSQGVDRMRNLREFVPYMTKFLTDAGIEFEIVIAEQTEGHVFNKGALFNAGFQLVKDRVDYVVLHDVDQVPENKENNYAYPERPKHLCSASSQWNYRPSYGQMVGGAIIMQTKHYEQANGFSNLYWGWGQEDDDFYFRLTKLGFMKSSDRLPPNIGRYKALDHTRVKDLDVTSMFRQNRQKLDKTIGSKSIPEEGLRTVKFDVVGQPRTDQPKGCTRYLIELKFDWMPRTLDERPPP